MKATLNKLLPDQNRGPVVSQSALLYFAVSLKVLLLFYVWPCGIFQK